MCIVHGGSEGGGEVGGERTLTPKRKNIRKSMLSTKRNLAPLPTVNQTNDDFHLNIVLVLRVTESENRRSTWILI